MSDLRTAVQKAIADICAARLCEVNSMSSRQEMLRLMIQATDTLRAALAQEEQKEAIPCAWMAIGGTIWRHKTREDDVPLYTTLPRRKWYGLEEWEINDGRDQLPTEDLCNWSFRQGAYFAEAKLKEKNA